MKKIFILFNYFLICITPVFASYKSSDEPDGLQELAVIACIVHW